MIRGFGSDNFSGVLPEVFKALEEASYGHQHSYGEDEYSAKAIADFKAIFGEHIEVFFCIQRHRSQYPQPISFYTFAPCYYLCRNSTHQC